MSANKKTFINYDRAEQDKLGRTIHIWRKREVYLSKADLLRARELREKMQVAARQSVTSYAL